MKESGLISRQSIELFRSLALCLERPVWNYEPHLILRSSTKRP